MLAKRSVKNQITLPKTVVARFGGIEYFYVSTDGETIILCPLQKARADEVLARLSQLDVKEQDVLDAVFWAVKPSPDVESRYRLLQ